MKGKVPNGEKRVVDGRLRAHYLGYWVKVYEPPADTLVTKKQLIEALTRRLFNHVEHGINIPGTRLDEARASFDRETDAARKRVKGAMLAGALFNRATDIITKLVELQALGIPIEPENALMRSCGEHLQEAMALGRTVLHRSGEEGIDELWGDPFKAFAYPVEQLYESRYLKIAQAMLAIDEITEELLAVLQTSAALSHAAARLREFAAAAKTKCETLRTDEEIFEVWTSVVVAGERLSAMGPALREDASPEELLAANDALNLIRTAKGLVLSIARARVPMAKSTADFVAMCAAYRTGRASRASAPRSGGPGLAPSRDPGVRLDEVNPPG